MTIRPGLAIPEAELSLRFSRSSGPGGQGVNTADSRVELSFDVARSPSLTSGLRTRALTRLAGRLVDGVLTVSAQEHRSQLANRNAAEGRLAALLRQATDPEPRARRATRPKRSAVEERLTTKKKRAQTKKDRRADPDD